MAEQPDNLQKTPLYAMHLAAGARMVPFAGYEMPVQYAPGVLKEHLHAREKAGLFDVSHMGQVEIRPRDGDMELAARALETIVPVSVLGIKEGRQRYALFTNDEGGVIDDLMIAHRGDHFFLVVNAACKEGDIAHMKARLSETVELVTRDDRALIALQGPAAEGVLSKLAPEAAEMKFMDSRALVIDGHDCIVSRSGYTGEDGYEIAIAADEAEALAQKLLADEAVEWIGLGARDSLRLEAGLCLYGNDLDATTTPAESSVEWAIQKVRRSGGEREGGFPGAEIILKQIEEGAAKRRVGLKPEGRAPVRAGAELYRAAEGGEPVGTVTSGGFGPSFGGPVAMGMVPADMTETGTVLYAEVRGKRLPVAVHDLPFVKQTYKR